MNYERIYNEFIADRRGKEANLIASGEYKEHHHIVPRSMGGTDDTSNIIALAAGDHLFAHMILAKAHGGKMVLALRMMLYGSYKTRGRDYPAKSKRLAYGMAKSRFSEVQSELVSDHFKNPEVRRAHSEKLKELHKANPELRLKQAETLKQRYACDDGLRVRISEGNVRRFEQKGEREAQSMRLKKYFQTPSAKEKNRQAQKQSHADNPELKLEMSLIKKRYYAEMPGAREKNSDALKEYYKKPGAKEKNSRALKSYYKKNPQVLEEMSIARKKLMEERPEIAANHSKHMKQRYMNNPELGEVHSQKLKAISKLRKAYCLERGITKPGKGCKNIDKADFEAWKLANICG